MYEIDNYTCTAKFITFTGHVHKLNHVGKGVDLTPRVTMYTLMHNQIGIMPDEGIW